MLFYGYFFVFLYFMLDNTPILAYNKDVNKRETP
uniref:Uncharacterized protein n=1 Tax=Siphoviridae sp. ctY1p61 TaxID=2826373 RepID=A0A8S5NM70_9CAUD|nr:MAG TPA: hypothetical protein [Siphoviridae sp. ctY1p61]